MSMSTFLSKFSSKGRRFILLGFWLVLLGVVVPSASKLTSIENNSPSSYLPTGSQSAQVINAFSHQRLSAPNDALVVISSQSSISTNQIKTLVASIPSFKEVSGVGAPPALSKDGKYLAIDVSVRGSGLAEVTKSADTLTAQVARFFPHSKIYIGGTVGYLIESSKAFGLINGSLLLYTGLIIIIILLLTYRSPILWIFPIVAASLSLEFAQGIIYLLSKYFYLTVSGETQGILTVLVLGASTDYAILLISRYREELSLHSSKYVAMAEAWRESLKTMFFAASTVAASLFVLVISSLASDRGLGPIGAIGIISSFLVMATLLPPLLLLGGRFIFWPFVPKNTSEVRRGIFNKIGTLIEKRPKVLGGSTLLLLVILGGIGLSTLTLNTPKLSKSFTGNPPPIVAQQIIDTHLPTLNSTAFSIVGPNKNLKEVSAYLKEAYPDSFISTSPLGSDVAINLLLNVPTSSPQATTDLLSIRQHLNPQDFLVGGSLATNYDIEQATIRDLEKVAPLVLFVILLVLILILRALLGPILLLLTIVISLGATLGISTLIFSATIHYTTVDWGWALFTFIFITALGTDYNVFLVSRFMEDSYNLPTTKAMLSSLSSTGVVITSAGVVLAATFSILGIIPITFLFELGVSVALGVLLDTLLVRSVIVPALVFTLGDKFFWPRQIMPIKETQS